MLKKESTDQDSEKYNAIELFQNTHADKRVQSPFFKTLKQISNKPSFLKITMSKAFYKEEARAEAIFILRFLSNQCLRSALNNSELQEKFLANVKREISLKSGGYEAEIMVRDALMENFFYHKVGSA